LTGTGHQLGETTGETIKATTSEDGKTPIAIKGIAHKTTFKEMRQPQGTNQTPAFNAVK